MTDTTIAFVHARRVWDSRGLPTAEAEVLLEEVDAVECLRRGD